MCALHRINGCISDFLGRNINGHVHLIFPHDPLTVFHPVRTIMNTLPLSVIGWINVYVELEFVIVCDLGAQTAHRDAFF